MKKWFKLPILFSIVLIVLASCNNDDDDNNSLPDPSMSANIDGISWTADVSLTGSTGGNVLLLTGAGSNGTQIVISVVNYTGESTYDIPSGNSNSFGRWNSGTEQFSTTIGGTGTVNVTTDNGNQVSGTFSFTALSLGANNASITQGEFTVDL